MGNTSRRAPWGVIGLALVVALTGCAAGSAASDDDGSVAATPNSASPTARDARATVDFGDAPEPADAPSCSALLPDDLVHALVPGARVVDAADQPHVTTGFSAATAAGGLDCFSHVGDDTTVDDVVPGGGGDAAYRGVSLTVLPDAAGEWAREAANVDGIGSVTKPDCAASDSARVFCWGGSLAGNAWVSLNSGRPQDTSDATPEQALPAYRALLDHVTAAISAAPIADVRTDHTVPDVEWTACTPTNVNRVTDVELRDLVSNTDTPHSIDAYAQHRLDADACTFTSQTTADPDRPYAQQQALYSTLPGGGWAVEDRLAAGSIDRDGRIELDGLGARDGAWRTCDETACSVDVVEGGDWSHYVLFTRVAPDTSTAVVDWVEASRG